MMDEILLTDEEAEDIVHGEHDVCSRCEGEGRLWADGLAHYYDPNRPTKACPNCDGTGRVWSGREYEALCRAQVRRAYDYMRTHWLQARQLDYHTAQDNTVQLTIKSEDWQALREAAGEGK